MGDLISRKAAIEALGEEPPIFYDGEDEIAERVQWRRDVNAIKALPSAQPEQEWISVEERLPEAAGDYMVAYHPCHWDDVHYDRTLVGMDNFRGKAKWSRCKFQRVTHWMPLPEPPELDKEGETDE